MLPGLPTMTEHVQSFWFSRHREPHCGVLVVRHMASLGIKVPEHVAGWRVEHSQLFLSSVDPWEQVGAAQVCETWNSIQCN